jgi:hypothetical protein
VHPAFAQLSADSMGACRFADDSSDDVLRPHNGVFLPLLRDSRQCCKDPLVLAYAPPRGVHGELVGHFSACLPTRVEGHTAALKIPIGQSSTEAHMPVRFAPANADQRQMLEKYLRIEKIGLGERQAETPMRAVEPSSPSGSNPELQEALRKSLEGAAEASEGAFVLVANVIRFTREGPGAPPNVAVPTAAIHMSVESHPWLSPTRALARREGKGEGEEWACAYAEADSDCMVCRGVRAQTKPGQLAILFLALGVVRGGDDSVCVARAPARPDP